MKKNKLLYLIIYTLFFNLSFSQNIYLKITGKDSISKTFINTIPLSKSFKNIKELTSQLTTLTTHTHKKGYFNSTLSDKQKINDSTYTYELTLNKKFDYITIQYNNITEKELRNYLSKSTIVTKKYFISSIPQLENNLNNIIKLHTDKGKLFTKCQLSNIHIENEMIFASLKLKQTKQKNITNIKIKGYEKFPEKFIKHYLKLKTSETLNPDKLKKLSNNINNLTFANENKKPEILFTKDSSVVYLYINKQKSNNFEGFLGFSSNPETNKIDFNGNINLKLINNLNSGEELYLKYHSTENSQRTIFVKTIIPFILNTPFSLEGEMTIFKKDSTFTNTQQKLSTNYLLGNNLKLGVGTTFNNSNSLTEELINNTDFKKTYLTSYLSHHINYKKNNLYPYKTKTLLELSIGNRVTDINKTKQQNIFLSSEYIFDLNKKNSIYLKTTNNYLISNTILENELNYIGGINSIRGYQENSIPSIIYSVLNTEYRIELNKTLYTHTVFDYAITKNNSTSENNNLLGFGLGFGLNTNNNLVRFIIANSKNNGEKIKFNNTKIHLSLSTKF